MRIVAGALKGRPIRTPQGPETRPTSDRARQAVFNILEHAAWSPDLAGARVLDLFAGSGAMGLEALSRGAGSCLFVEQAEPACAAIRANIDALGLHAAARLLKRDVRRLGGQPETDPGFDIAFLDPPYRTNLAAEGLSALRAGGWLASEALAVVEVGAAEPLPPQEGFEAVDERRYGAARLVFLRATG